MPFWTYMLHCADRSFYVGHTDDLELRLRQHDQASLGGYTSSRLPVKLVWCSEFPTRYEALAAERQIKGWSRVKKMALIRDDWEAISRLSKSRKEKEKASTSSARTVRGPLVANSVRSEPVEGSTFFSSPLAARLPLNLHRDCRSAAVSRIEVEASRPNPNYLHFRYLVTGSIADLLVPPPAQGIRTDDLWRHTCFEAFLRVPAHTGYCEFNLSPSTEWAAYHFGGYRSGMRPLNMPAPRIGTWCDTGSFELSALLDLPVDGPLHLALSAVIEEKNGRKSYWALAHPAAKPDFHHPDSFVCELP